MSDSDNPFGDAIARANSNLCVLRNQVLVGRDSAVPPTVLTQFVHDTLRALVLNEHYTCDGAKAALRQGNYGFGLYGTLASEQASAGLARDLFTFMHSDPPANGFLTYLASFTGPHPKDEADFERLLWDTLQQLHVLDRPHHAWDPSASPDPADHDFAFSFGGEAYFIIGLHAASSRAARRVAWPTLVFNPHRQFDELRRANRYTRFQQVIRRAELSLQGAINPMLSDHGTTSEAPQYSGREVSTDWHCPFKIEHGHEPTEN